MSGQVTYDGLRYKPFQAQGLIRRLTANGWRITIVAAEDTRRPGAPQNPYRWLCQVGHSGYDSGSSRIGDTLWDCLRRAVEDLVVPAEGETGYGRPEVETPGRPFLNLETMRRKLQEDERIIDAAMMLKIGVDRDDPMVETVRRCIAAFVLGAFEVSDAELHEMVGAEGRG